jgi:hypothetical protein
VTVEHLSFLSGAVTMGFCVAALFFAKFWRRTGDTLFAMFSLAFILLAIEQVALVALGADREENTSVYLLRLTAFCLIVLAILLKNRERRR